MDWQTKAPGEVYVRKEPAAPSISAPRGWHGTPAPLRETWSLRAKERVDVRSEGPGSFDPGSLRSGRLKKKGFTEEADEVQRAFGEMTRRGRRSVRAVSALRIWRIRARVAARARYHPPCRIFSTLATSGSTTMVLLRFLSAVSGSLSPWPVSVHTTTEPGRSPPVAANLSAPATEAAEAGSAKTPCVAIKRYAARISASVTRSIIPPDSSRAASALFQLAGLPILIAVATVCGSSIGWPSTIGADSAAW